MLALGRAREERWEQFCARHGDWDRDAALWLRMGAGRLRQEELVRLAGRLDDAVASKAIARFDLRLQTAPPKKVRKQLAGIQKRLSE